MGSFFRRIAGAALLFVLMLGAAQATPLTLSAIQVDPGNQKLSGATFTYRLTYTCESAGGPCLNAQVVQLLPIEVTELSTVPTSPAGDVAGVNVTPNFGGSGRTRVQFVFVSPLPAGNSGDLLLNVRFPNGSTPNGTVASATADGINLGSSPGTFTTPPVNVMAVASNQATLQKTLTTAPANLNTPESYRLRISNASANGVLNLTAIGPVTDTLPPGTAFNGATPAADCQPGCVGTTPATVTWTSPCTPPLVPGSNCDINVNVTFPSATFPSGSSVTNSFVATVTALGASPGALAAGSVTHPVTTFVPTPAASLTKTIAAGSANPPTLTQTFSYSIAASNTGNVPLDNVSMIDTLPVQFQLANVTTGSYSGASDFAAGVGVRVSYEKNTAPGVFTLWGSSPNAATNTTLTSPPPGLGAGEYVTRVRWESGQWQPGATANTTPTISGRIITPDNIGTPVAFGNTIQNCSALTAVYTAGPTNVLQNSCQSFALSGPFVQLNPAADLLSGAGPFSNGQSLAWRLRVRSAAQSSDPAPLAGVVATALLPIGLNLASWSFDDQATGLPAPQNFSGTLANFGGTGRTLLRWTWNAGSGNLGVNQQVWINLATTVNGIQGGAINLDTALASNAPGPGQRCSGSSAVDSLDQDNDGSTADQLCTSSGTVNVVIAPAFTSLPPPGAAVGDAYSYTVGASGFPAPAFDLSSGALPPTLTLNPASGLISGTTTTSGTFSGTIRASNAVNPPATQAFSISIAKRTQTLTFGANPGPVSYAPFATFTVSASASSMLPPSFTSLTGTVCNVAASTVTLLGAGTCTIQADQAGDATFLPAAPVTQDISIQRGAQTITFGPATPIAFSAAAITLGATSSSGLSAFAFATTTPAICSITGNSLTRLAAGSCALTASQAGDSNYLPASANATVVITAVLSFTGTTATGSGTATASFTGGGTGCTLDLAQTGFVAGTSGADGGYFPHGWLRFRMVGCARGAVVHVSTQWPGPVTGSYLKYGRTPDSGGATIFYVPANLTALGTTAAFDVTDGALGDDDLRADGIIIDPSGPYVVPTAVSLPQTVTLLLLVVLLPLAGWQLRTHAASRRQR